jgi:BA14K-like protein
MRLVLGVALLTAVSVNAQATVQDYCKAYAQDIADQVEQQSPRWKIRYDNAEKSCLFRFTTSVQPAVKAKSKPKLAVVKKPVKQKLIPKPELKPKTETKVVAKAIPQLEPGSAEWTDYCKKKYVSFDEAKGTYLSKTGVERKCMVTAD